MKPETAPSSWVFPVGGCPQPTDQDGSWATLLEGTVGVPIAPHPGGFGVVRTHHTHEGIDLYVPEGTPVYPVEPGRIVAWEHFTGPEAGSPWWASTQAVLVEGASGVVVYGEIQPVDGLPVGTEVSIDTRLGHVCRVLRKDKGRPMDMLHLELHAAGTRQSVAWDPHAVQPTTLRDPTALLAGAQARPPRRV